MLKGIPDFCTLYVIGKSKISFVKNATSEAPPIAHNQIQKQSSKVSDTSSIQSARKKKPQGWFVLVTLAKIVLFPNAINNMIFVITHSNFFD